MILDGTDADRDKPLLLRAIEMLVAGPDDIRKVVEQCRARTRKCAKTELSEEDERIEVANALILRYAKTCGRVGAVTAGAGALPGIGTVVALIGSTAADLAITMKYQIEMVTALAHLFGRDITNEEEQRLIYTVAGLGIATQAGLLSFERFTIQGIREAVKHMVKGRWKKWIFELFKKLGLKLTERGILRVIPFGIGVTFTYYSNRKLTRYIGRRARDYFIGELARADNEL
jgi:uncharacterized protein (DUF697 family)